MRTFGRWLFEVALFRRTALALLILFPEFRRKLRIYVGVEGGVHFGALDPLEVSPHVLKALPQRVADIYADLETASRRRKS